MSLPALSVNPSGRIVDVNNKIVYLRGMNTAGTEFGDGTGVDLSQARFNALTRYLNINLIRLAINASWWNNNSAIPTGNTYQNWIATLISQIEAANCYCEVSCVTAFCTITGNPPQNFVDSCNNTETLIFTAYNTFWTNFVPLYKNDPMVLYNVANEPAYSDAITQQKTLLSTVKGIAPNAVVVLDSRNYVPNITGGSETEYSGSNLIVDWHVYDDPTNWWYQKMSTQNPNASFGVGFAHAQAHGLGVMIGEYNLTPSWNHKGFALEIARRQVALGYGNAYYNEQNLMLGDNSTLVTPDGPIVAAANALVAAGNNGWFSQ